MPTPRELLLQKIPKGAVCAEIGVFRGQFSARILTLVQPKTFYLIDPWINRDEDGLEQAWYHKDSQHKMNDIFLQVQERFSKQIASGQVEMLRGMSGELLAQMPDNSLDFLYIDGDHRYDAVLEDLALGLCKVRPDGLIGLDDYELGGWWGDGVVRAVNDTLGRHAHDLKIEFADASQVLLRRRRST